MARLFSVLARAGDALVDRQAADQLGEWLLEDAGSDAKRWAELAKRFGDFPPPMRKAYVTKLADFAAKQPSDADRAYLQNALRGLIHKQRKFIDAQWALPEEDLAELEAVYDALSPNDEIKKIEWLFEAYGIAQLHPPPARNFRAGEVSSNTERQRAIDQIVSRQGVSGILALIDKVKLPALVGKAVAEVAPAAMTDDLMLRGLRAGTDAGRNFAFGIIRASNQAAGPEWGLALLERARAEGWPDNTIVDILMSLPRSEAVLRASSTFGPDVERRYWSEAGMQWISAEDENIGWVAEKLIDFGRARDAIHLMGSHLDNTAVRLTEGCDFSIALQDKGF